MNPESLAQRLSTRGGLANNGRVDVVSASATAVTLRLTAAERRIGFNSGSLADYINYAALAAAAAAIPPERAAVMVAMEVTYLVARDFSETLAQTRVLRLESDLCVVAVDAVSSPAEGSVPCAVATATLKVVDAKPSHSPQ